MKAGMKSWGVLVLGVFLAAIAAWATMTYIDVTEKTIKDSLLGEGSMMDVVVPVNDIVAGEALMFDMVNARSVPVDYMPSGVITPEEFDLYEGMILNEDMPRGKPILRSNLVGGAIASFSGLLKEGERALTLSISGHQSNAGMLQAGDFIDVVLKANPLGITKDDENQVQVLSPDLVLLLERVTVLATGNVSLAQQQVMADGEAQSEYDNITIAVKTKDFARIQTAMQLAKLKGNDLLYLMRNPADKTKAKYDNTLPALDAGYVSTITGGTGGELVEKITVRNASIPVDAIGQASGAARIARRFKGSLTEPVIDQAPAPEISAADKVTEVDQMAHAEKQ